MLSHGVLLISRATPSREQLAPAGGGNTGEGPQQVPDSPSSAVPGARGDGGTLIRPGSVGVNVSAGITLIREIKEGTAIQPGATLALSPTRAVAGFSSSRLECSRQD